MMPRLHFIFRTNRPSSTSSSSAQPPYELINTIVTPHPDARQLTIEINSSSASDVLFEMTEYAGGDQHPDPTTILSTTSSRKRIREDPVSTALNKTVPTSGAAAAKTTGSKKKAKVEGPSVPPKDSEPNNQVPKTTAKKQPAAQSSKPTMNASSLAAVSPIAVNAVKAPAKKPATATAAKGGKIPTPTNVQGADPSTKPNQAAKTNKADGTKQDGKKTLSDNSNATEKKAADKLKEPLKTSHGQESEKTHSENKSDKTAASKVDSVAKADTVPTPSPNKVSKETAETTPNVDKTSASMEQSVAKVDTEPTPSPTKIPKETTTESEKGSITTSPVKEEHGNTTSMAQKSAPKLVDDSFRSKRIAKKIKGTVIQGQVDSFNGTHYFCTFMDGKKMRLTEQSFQEAVDLFKKTPFPKPQQVKVESSSDDDSSDESDDSTSSEEDSSSSEEISKAKIENQGTMMTNVKRQPLVAQDKLLSLKKNLK